MRLPPPLILGPLTSLLVTGTACLVATSQDAANNASLSESRVETGATSISGIPLDMDARFGRVLVTVASIDRGSFNIGEEDVGIAPAVAHKLLNVIVRPRTWGVEADLTGERLLRDPS